MFLLVLSCSGLCYCSSVEISVFNITLALQKCFHSFIIIKPWKCEPSGISKYLHNIKKVLFFYKKKRWQSGKITPTKSLTAVLVIKI